MLTIFTDRVTSPTSAFIFTPEYLAPLWRCIDSLQGPELALNYGTY